MEWSMLWKDLLAGFLIGGFLAVFVPDSVWQALFLVAAPEWPRVPIIAIFTFVCSIGNVLLAAVLFSSGASFGGVLAFLYADLIPILLMDAYRRHFGRKPAADMAKDDLSGNGSTDSAINRTVFETGSGVTLRNPFLFCVEKRPGYV